MLFQAPLSSCRAYEPSALMPIGKFPTSDPNFLLLFGADPVRSPLHGEKRDSSHGCGI
jgi:hypothetical protein